MKRISQEQRDRLSAYLDGMLDPAARIKLEAELKTDEAMRAEFDELRSIHVLLKSVKLEQPSKNFTSQLMSRLDQYPSTRPSIHSFRNGILLLCGVLIAIGVASILVSAGEFDSVTTTLKPDSLPIPSKIVNYSLPSISISGKMMVNVIIILNLVLAWLVLDRVILKPWFQRRMQER